MTKARKWEGSTGRIWKKLEKTKRRDLAFTRMQDPSMVKVCAGPERVGDESEYMSTRGVVAFRITTDTRGDTRLVRSA